MRVQRWVLRGTALSLGLLLASCSVSGPRADEEDLVEAYVMAIRTRERGEGDEEVKRLVGEWLQDRDLTREDLRDLVARLDNNPGRWARVWSRIDEQLRSTPRTSSTGPTPRK